MRPSGASSAPTIRPESASVVVGVAEAAAGLEGPAAPSVVSVVVSDPQAASMAALSVPTANTSGSLVQRVCP